jgi:hypothetical protein
MSDRPKADRRLYFNADRTELVEEGDPRGAFLACASGDPIPETTKQDKPAEPETKAKDKAEDKAAPKVPNKGKKPTT